MDVKKGYAMVLIAALTWGCIGIFVNDLTALGLGSASIAALRLLFGAAMLAPVLAVMGARGSGVPVGERPSARALFHVPLSSLVPCALVGIVGLAFANLGYYISMGEVGMSTASVLLYTMPVFGVALGRLLYREPVTSSKLASIAINVIGCVLAVTNGDFSTMGFSALGIIAGVAAGFMGALLAVFSKVATKRVHPLAVTFYGFVFGGATMLALACPWTDIAAAASPRLLLVLLGFGLIPTALAYIFYMNGLSMGLEASRVPVVASFETVTTVLVGIGVYGESAGPVKMAGICLVLLSIFVMNTSFEKIRRSELYGHVAESMRFSGRAWAQEKAAGYAEFVSGGDWQAWVALR